MLVCSHCGSQMIAEDRIFVSQVGWTVHRRCLKCGRDKIQDKDVQNYSKSDHTETGTSPLQTGENVSKKEENMGTHGKKCTAEGCEKGAWLKGLCHKHYMEKYGEYVPVKRGTGVVVPKKEKRPTEAIIPEQAAMEQGENRKDPAPLPGLRIIIPDKLLEKLAFVAEREYRTVNQQAAYFVTKGLERE